MAMASNKDAQRKNKGKAKMFEDPPIQTTITWELPVISLDDDDSSDPPKPETIIQKKVPVINIDDDDDDNDNDNETPSLSYYSMRKKGKKAYVDDDYSPSFFSAHFSTFECEICAEKKPQHESFNIKGCTHCYCMECTRNYVSSKLDEGASDIGCPVSQCSGILDPEYCRDILPPELFGRWGRLLCESVIDGAQKFYCPFKDCSVLLIDDGGEHVTRAECPYCNRLFCAKCRAVWHEGVVCEEYQKLSKGERDGGDLKLRNLAKAKGWDRCPHCGYYVELISGCSAVSCRSCAKYFTFGQGALRN